MCPIFMIGNNMFGDIGIIVVLMCLAELVSSLLTYLSTFLMTKVGINVSTELKTKFYNNMIELPSYKLDAMQSGNLLTRYETDINNLSDFLSSYLVSFIMNFFSFLIILYFSFSINIILTCIVIIFLPISLYIERLFSGKLKKNIRELRCMNDEYLTLFTETIKGNSDLKLLRAEKFFIYKMEKFQIFYKDSVTKLNLTRNLGSFIKKSIFVFLELVMLFVGIKYIKFGVLTIGNFIAFSNYSARLNNSISQIIRVYGSFNERAIAQKPQIFLFDEPTSALDVENRSEILQIIQNLSTRNTVIMITHDREIIGEFDKANIVEIDNLIQRPS